ncbi:hypothetical protein CROQUDRAFT_89550 [Cronartium quercuum f. sp. fusiforme G11]|uniref:Uncharacterized protein n=1 Tax=Cronartium quercuum f. sp. fusiforme G11 TaxID=708437 RepID=A0A9P6NMZ0_9BASI|nr:hypothetical protein CROQUDRAFT_89550 [Cronartium quercuum f. sp. fusiforme G11]
MKDGDKLYKLSTRAYPTEFISHEYSRFKRWLSTQLSAPQTHLVTELACSPRQFVRRQVSLQTPPNPSTTSATLSPSTSSTLQSSPSPQNLSTAALPNQVRPTTIPPQGVKLILAHSTPPLSTTTTNNTINTNGTQSIRPNATTLSTGSVAGVPRPLPQSSAPPNPRLADPGPDSTTPEPLATPTAHTQPSIQTNSTVAPKSVTTKTSKPSVKPLNKSHKDTENFDTKKEFVIIGLACVTGIILVVVGVIIYKIQASKRQHRKMMEDRIEVNLNSRGSHKRDVVSHLKPLEEVYPSTRRPSYYDISYPPLPPPPPPSIPFPIPPLPPQNPHQRVLKNHNPHDQRSMDFHHPRTPPPIHSGRLHTSRERDHWNREPSCYDIDIYYGAPEVESRSVSQYIDTRYTLRSKDYDVMQPDDRPYDPRYIVDQRGQLRYETQDTWPEEDNENRGMIKNNGLKYDERDHHHQQHHHQNIYGESPYSVYSNDRTQVLRKTSDRIKKVSIDEVQMTNWSREPFESTWK